MRCGLMTLVVHLCWFVHRSTCAAPGQQRIWPRPFSTVPMNTSCETARAVRQRREFESSHLTVSEERSWSDREAEHASRIPSLEHVAMVATSAAGPSTLRLLSTSTIRD